ncbi:Uncharacterized protein ChrSV_5079 [Chromobacterium vaccinii]|nr:Uncharacterized protein ChrSW_5073 [Chromobacterium vaccinii]QND92534.1 Uncharacterized protein ChrSV_5079 [Chromobacterium vaccinii]
MDKGARDGEGAFCPMPAGLFEYMNKINELLFRLSLLAFSCKHLLRDLMQTGWVGGFA